MQLEGVNSVRMCGIALIARGLAVADVTNRESLEGLEANAEVIMKERSFHLLL